VLAVNLVYRNRMLEKLLGLNNVSTTIFTRDSVAIARICHGNSVCLSVCHTGGSAKNG